MSAPYNGWQAEIAIQKETAFDSPSAETTYNLAGKIKVSQVAEFVGRGRTVNVWRTENTNFFSGRFYSGTIELELGLNEVLMLLLSAFFEVESTSQVPLDASLIFGEGSQIFGEGGTAFGEATEFATQYVLRPSRLQSVKSFKLGIDFDRANTAEIFGEGSGIFGEGGAVSGDATGAITSVKFSGMVIDQMVFDIRRNQVPKLQIQFKAARREVVQTAALGASAAVDNHNAHHFYALTRLDADNLKLTESSLVFAQRKTPNRFNADKRPTRFSVEPFFMTGQLAEYHGPDASLSDAILDQNEHVLFLQLLDPDGSSRKLEVHWPSVNLSDALPDLLGREDLICRANISGLQSIGFDSNGPKIVLVV